MSELRITAGPYSFKARLLEADAPQTCVAFLKLLPYRQQHHSRAVEWRGLLDSPG